MTAVLATEPGIANEMSMITHHMAQATQAATEEF